MDYPAIKVKDIEAGKADPLGWLRGSDRFLAGAALLSI